MSHHKSNLGTVPAVSPHSTVLEDPLYILGTVPGVSTHSTVLDDPLYNLGTVPALSPHSTVLEDPLYNLGTVPAVSTHSTVLEDPLYILKGNTPGRSQLQLQTDLHLGKELIFCLMGQPILSNN
jgi:hypothetical protein